MFGAAASPALDATAKPPYAEPPSPTFPEPSEQGPTFARPTPPSAPNTSDASSHEPPKIRVMWRSREAAPSAAPPPSREPSAPPFAPPAGPPAFGSAPPAATPAPFAAPPASLQFGGPSLTPRSPGASLGPPELKLGDANEMGERVEPHLPAPVPSSAPPPRASGPSDFTRMLTPVEAPKAAPAAPAVKPNAKAEGAVGGRKPSLLPLLIVLIFAFVAAAALILYVVLRN